MTPEARTANLRHVHDTGGTTGPGSHASPPRPRRCPLNPIELAIIRHLANGTTRTTIAREVGLAPTSMPATVSRIFTKIGAVNATSAVATALREGWIR